MRVTNSIMVSNLKSYLQNGLQKLDEYNKQIATGKRFTLPHEDPIATQRSMTLYSALESNKQYQKNIGRAQDWLLNTEAAIKEVNDVLHRLHELAVRGANDSMSQSSRDAIADEVDELNEHLFQLANTKVAGKYIFSGTKTDTKTFDSLTAPAYNGDTINLSTEINPGIKINHNISGDRVFGPNGELFQMVSNLSNDLRTGDRTTISNTRIGEINTRMDDIMTVFSEIGAKVNRLELSTNRLTGEELNLNTLISSNEDVDVAEAITNLKMQENIYRATLASGARIIQPSLVDFLR